MAAACWGVAAAPPAPRRLTLAPYLAEVGRCSLQLMGQRAGVAAAAAQVAAARVFMEPVLSAGVNTIDPLRQQPFVTNLSVAQTLELGGKHGRRVAVAQAAYLGAQADFIDSLRDVRAQAATAFIEALQAQLALQRRQQTLVTLERLVSINARRFAVGDIGEVAVVQSRVEAARFAGEVVDAEGEVQSAQAALLAFLDSQAENAQVLPLGPLAMQPRTIQVAQLRAQAMVHRPDVQSLQAAVLAARQNLHLARANRIEDVTLSAGWQHTFAAPGPPSVPAYEALTGMLSVPLPLARINYGAVDTAWAQVRQAEAQLQAKRVQADVDVQQAAARYAAVLKRLNLYTGGVLADADRVLDATLYSYQRGAARLLEVLEAQRTVNDVYLAYYAAQADHAKSLIALEQATGKPSDALDGPAPEVSANLPAPSVPPPRG